MPHPAGASRRAIARTPNPARRIATACCFRSSTPGIGLTIALLTRLHLVGLRNRHCHHRFDLQRPGQSHWQKEKAGLPSRTARMHSQHGRIPGNPIDDAPAPRHIVVSSRNNRNRRILHRRPRLSAVAVETMDTEIATHRVRRLTVARLTSSRRAIMRTPSRPAASQPPSAAVLPNPADRRRRAG